MALKSFYIRGEFSGRSTPITGGPRISAKDSWMVGEVLQRDNGETFKIVEIESKQEKRRLTTFITIHFPDGSPDQEFKIETKY